MKPLATAFALALSTAALPAHPAETAQPVWALSLHSLHHDDALPLSMMGDKGTLPLAPRKGRNIAYIDDELRLSRSQGGWAWSVLARSYALVVTNEESLALYTQVAGGGRPGGDRSWNADLKLRAFSGVGLALGRAQTWGEGWTWHGEAQVLRLGRWRQRSIDGAVSFGAATGSYQFDLHSQESDNRLDFPYQESFAANGAALLWAGGVAWEGAAAWAELGLRDAGWMFWRGLPQQQLTLNTATQGVDTEGFVSWRPLLEGRNSQGGRRGVSAPRGSAAAGIRCADGERLGLRLETLPDGGGLLPALTWQRPATTPGDWAWGADWHWVERRLALSLGWRGLQLHLGTDRWGSSARSREIAFSWSASL